MPLKKSDQVQRVGPLYAGATKMIQRVAAETDSSMAELPDDTQQALDCLREAVAQALERKRRLGHYAVIWRDGQVVRIEGEELRTPPRPPGPHTGT